MTPDGWTKRRLDECASQITSGGTPKIGRPDYYDGDVPFLKIDDLTTNRGRYLRTAKTTISTKALDETSAKLYPEDTVLVTMYGTIGAVGITAVPMAANQAIGAFLKLQGVTPDFLAFLLTREAPALSRKAGRTTQSNINGRILRNHEVLIPPLTEQRKIAAILSSVDDAIEKTQAVIHQVQIVKRGLMQELFTRGLPGRHTRLKRTVIGDVPKVWEVKTVGAVAAPGGRSCIGGPFGSDLTRKDYVDSPGVPVIRGSNLAGSSGWLKEDDFVFVSDTKAKALQRNTASPGDVIVTQRGTLGQVCMIPMQSKFPRYVLSQSQMRVSVDERQVSPEFLLAYFRSSKALKQIEAMTIGTGVPHLNLGILRAFPVPVPALEEQRVIVRYLSATDARIDSELRSLRTLKVLKSALMSVLLTGELRVTPDPEAE